MEDRFDHFFVAPSDFERALHFYSVALGWTLTSSWGDASSGRGATLRSGAIEVAIAEKHSDDPADSSNRAINGARPTLYIAVHDLEARYAALRDRADIVAPLETTHWGIRWFVVRDPDGNLLAFTEPR